jgi:hypothetical protein
LNFVVVFPQVSCRLWHWFEVKERGWVRLLVGTQIRCSWNRKMKINYWFYLLLVTLTEKSHKRKIIGVLVMFTREDRNSQVVHWILEMSQGGTRRWSSSYLFPTPSLEGEKGQKFKKTPPQRARNAPGLLWRLRLCLRSSLPPRRPTAMSRFVRASKYRPFFSFFYPLFWYYTPFNFLFFYICFYNFILQLELSFSLFLLYLFCFPFIFS